MTTQPEALRLAEKLAYYGEFNDCGMDDNPTKQYMREAATELRRLHEEVNQLNLAEMGAKEAFGVVVIAKQHLEAECRVKQRTIFDQKDVIVTMRQQPNALMDACKAWLADETDDGEFADTLRTIIDKAGRAA